MYGTYTRSPIGDVKCVCSFVSSNWYEVFYEVHSHARMTAGPICHRIFSGVVDGDEQHCMLNASATDSRTWESVQYHRPLLRCFISTVTDMASDTETVSRAQ